MPRTTHNQTHGNGPAAIGGALTVVVSNVGLTGTGRKDTFTVRIPAAVECRRLTLKQYGIETFSTELGVRVDLSFLPEGTQFNNAAETLDANNHIVLAHHDSTAAGQVYSLGSGVSFRPTNDTIPATFTVKVYDLGGTLYEVKHLTMAFAISN